MDSIEWLGRPDLFDGTERRELPWADGYQDYALVLTAQEVREWHAKDRHLSFEGVYSSPAWQVQIRPRVEELERLLSSSHCPNFFVAHWYEWESGYG